MAITTNIPPQAYTRDTLVKAIEWMNQQPASLRERAGSADLIVSYYLQARRRMTAAQMEAPVSGESFKADLKHLAEDLKQFEEPSAPPTQPNRAFDHLQEVSIPQMELPLGPFNPPRVAPQHSVHQPAAAAAEIPNVTRLHTVQEHVPVYYSEPVHQVPAQPRVQQQFVPPPQPPAQPHHQPPPHQAPPQQIYTPPAPSAPKVTTWTIDPRSLASARELQQRMNLSSETEALRMLVTLGVERMREVFGGR